MKKLNYYLVQKYARLAILLAKLLQIILDLLNMVSNYSAVMDQLYAHSREMDT
jgi:hypothetical protein